VFIAVGIGWSTASSADNLDAAAEHAVLEAVASNPRCARFRGSRAKLIQCWAAHIPANTKDRSGVSPLTPNLKASPSPPKTDTADVKPKPAEPFSNLLPPPWMFVVRKDFADLGVFARASSGDPKVTGATISYSDDRAGKNVSWMLQGVGTLGTKLFEKDLVKDPGDGLLIANAGVYGGVDKFTNTNSAPKTPSKDNVIWGGFLESGFTRSEFIQGTESPGSFQDYIQFLAGGVTNNSALHKLFTIKKTTVSTTESATQFATSARWMPVYWFGSFDSPSPAPAWLNIIHQDIHSNTFEDVDSLGNSYKYNVVARFDPELIAQYNNSFDTTSILNFSYKSSAFRLGPQAKLSVFPFFSAEDSGSDLIHNIGLNNISITAVYHYWHEFVGRQNDYSAQANLNYKLTSNVNVSFGYTRGADENSGARMNLFTASIAGQLCTNCPGSAVATAGQ
jgi:hypothetical protein